MATDELYHDLQMHRSAQVLAEAFSDPETRGTGEKEPILWIVDYGKGRVFHTTLGHNATALAEPGFQMTFIRGCEWAASGKVTLSEHSMDDSAAAARPRVLVVTGGHSYDTDFYTLFDGDWLDWSHAVSNAEAFANDLRNKYDVVLLYDMSSELIDKGRDHLRNYLESGKGLLVVHHALADYNTWEWWWRDVVGGKYILEGTEQVKGSTYQHDVELFIRPVARHPITLGLGPMHFMDETYKNLWISEDVRVLLEVDEDTSDGPVAWISPYPHSRVAVIQLGHDKHAFLNPGYRELIRRSVLWAANRLD